MDKVLRRSDHLKVFETVIASDPILVIDLKARCDWPVERLPNKAVQLDQAKRPAITQANTFIITTAIAGLQDKAGAGVRATFGSHNPALVRH